MSRSYKKQGYSSCVYYFSDKEDRTRYHRNERRKVKRLLHEQLAYGTSIWEPISETCGLYGDVCNVDDWWCDDPSKYIINYDSNSTPKADFDSDCFMCRFSYFKKGYDYSEEPWEQIIMNKVDRSLHFADRYIWSSDGGVHWTADISKVREQFDTRVFSASNDSIPEIWKDYVNYRNISHNRNHKVWKVYTNWKGEKIGYWITNPSLPNSDWGLMEFLWYRKIIPTTFWGPKDLVDWMWSHEEEIIHKWFKMTLLRK